MKTLLSAMLVVSAASALEAQIAIRPTDQSERRVYFYDGVTPVSGGTTDAAGWLALRSRLSPGRHSIRVVEWGTGKAESARTIDVPLRTAGTLSESTPYLSDSFLLGAAGVLRPGGALDVILASSGALTILQNDGTGTFGNPARLAGPAAPSALLVADLNGDGSPDIAMTGDGLVWVYLNQGDGTFGTPQLVTAGKGPVALAAADFNGDGIPDLAVANQFSNDVWLLAGDGSGSFRQLATIPVASDPRALVAGDWNGDGIPDLAVASFGTDEIGILTGSGNGAFQAALIHAGSGPIALAAGDLNGDGSPDLAVLYQNDQALRILSNDGSGHFEAGTALPVGASASALAIGDIGGAGTLSVLVAGGGIAVSDGKSFSASLPAVSGVTRAMVLGDFSRAGALSIAAATDTGVQVLLHQPRPTVTVTETGAAPQLQTQSAAVKAPVPQTQSSTIGVSNGNDSGAGSFRQALLDVANGGTIEVPANIVGTITLQSPLIVNKTVTINGLLGKPVLQSPSVGSVCLSTLLGFGICTKSQTIYKSQLMVITAPGVSVNNFTFQGGTAQGGNGVLGAPGGGGGAGMGGALFIDATNVTIDNCVFQNNSAVGGNGGTGAEVSDSSNPSCCSYSIGEAGGGSDDFLSDTVGYGDAQSYPSIEYWMQTMGGNGGGLDQTNGTNAAGAPLPVYAGTGSSARLYSYSCSTAFGGAGCQYYQTWYGGGGGGAGLGGAIYVHTGFTVVENSTFSNNASVGGGWAGDGGSDTCGALSFGENCWSGQSNFNGTNGSAKAGGIFVAPGAAVQTMNDSFSGDFAANAGGSQQCSYTDNVDVCGEVANNATPTAVAFSMSGTPLASENQAFPVTFTAVTSAQIPPYLISGVLVTFSAPTSGPSCTFGGAASVTIQTDVTGTANPGPCVANGTHGNFNVTISVSQTLDQCSSGVCYLFPFSGSQTYSLTVLVPTTVTLSSSANPSLLGSTVTLTATLGSTSATGSVMFLQGTTILGSAPAVNGVATLRTIMLTAGSYPLLARYAGNTVYGISNSAKLAHTVKTNFAEAFEGLVSYGTASYSQAAIGDFNGDGLPDIAAVYANSAGAGYASVFLGTGKGAYSGPVDYQTGTGANSIAVGDFNGDGKPDLVLGQSGGAAVLLGNGDGTFKLPGAGQLLTSPTARSLVVADFNQDGNADIAAITGNSSPQTTVTVWYGNGDGTFQQPVNYTSASANAKALVVADVNSLGFPDIVIANGSGGMDILGGQQGGGFQIVHLPLEVDAVAIATGDFNKDGTPDIALAGQIFETVDGFAGAKLTDTGTGVQETPPSGFSWTLVQAMDNLGSGNQGVYLVASGKANIYRKQGNGSGAFPSLASAITPSALGFDPNSLAVGDLNGDGGTDIVATGGAGVHVLLAKSPVVQLTIAPNAQTYTQGQAISYTLTVKNTGTGETDGLPISVQNNPGTGLVPGTLSGGTGWTCTAGLCTYSSSIAAGASAPALTFAATIASNAPASVTESATLSFNSISAPVSNTVTVTVGTTITASNATATYSANNQPVTLKATVTSTGGVVNSGTVIFTVLNGSTQLGAATTPANVSNGAASASYTLPGGTNTGTYTIVASYTGAGGFTSSSDNTHTLTVNAAGSTTTGANQAASFSATAQIVPLSAMVTSSAGTVNGGTVTFTVLNGGTTIGTATISGQVSAGNASVTYAIPASTAPGTYTIQAVYSGGANFTGSSDNTHTLTINSLGSTTMAASASATFSPSNQPVALSATVSSGGGTVNAGTITFTLLSGGTPIGSPVISGTVTGGSASSNYTLPGGTPAGTYTILASYSGGGGFSGSSDNTHTLTVNRATPSITWSNPASISFGSALSSAQLNAVANVPGTFVYTPPTGAVLAVGNNQTLSAQFTPTDIVDYNSAPASVQISVTPAITSGLIPTEILSRDPSTQDVIVELAIANGGTNTMTNIDITTAKIGAIGPITTLPLAVPDTPAGGVSTVVLTFPSTVGTSGTRAVLSFTGTSALGAFGGSTRVVLP
ncbi:MAG TPA: FG-GAP-like repeat-containing protein [Bryobacteraceae bacterium]|nr:FG-GAP-like repeat-containing protein [Bryobacteraceae bacterium]